MAVVESTRIAWIRAYWHHRRSWRAVMLTQQNRGPRPLRIASAGLLAAAAPLPGLIAPARLVSSSDAGMVAIRRKLTVARILTVVAIVAAPALVLAAASPAIIQAVVPDFLENMLRAAPDYFELSLVVLVIAATAAAVCAVPNLGARRPATRRAVPDGRRNCWVDADAVTGSAGPAAGAMLAMMRALAQQLPDADQVVLRAIDDRRLALYKRLFPRAIDLGNRLLYIPPRPTHGSHRRSS